MFGEHRRSGESPRFPSPWQEALTKPDVNVKISPTPSPFLNGSGEEQLLPVQSISRNSKWCGHNTETMIPIDRIFDQIGQTSCSQIPSPLSTATSSSATLHHHISSTPPTAFPSQQSLIISPSEDGSITKLIAERDKTGHIEYKLKLDAKVGGERFERLVTQLRWRLTEGGGEAIYELGILDDGTLIGISQSLMATSLRTLEQMAAELGATVMVLRVITLSNPPDLQGRFGARGVEQREKIKRNKCYDRPESTITSSWNGDSRRLSRRGCQLPHQKLSAKQRKRVTKRRIWDSETSSTDDGLHCSTGELRETSPIENEQERHFKTLHVDGKVYGPDEDWPILLKADSDGWAVSNETSTPPSPSSWKARNLAAYALASASTNHPAVPTDRRGAWKPKREYDQDEKEQIREERRRRRGWRRRHGGQVDDPIKRQDGLDAFGFEDDSGDMFELDSPVGQSPAALRHHTRGGPRLSDTHAKDHVDCPLNGGKRKPRMKKNPQLRQQRKDSRRASLLMGDGADRVTRLAQDDLHESSSSAVAGSDVKATGDEESGDGFAGFAWDEDSDDEADSVIAKDVVRRMMGSSLPDPSALADSTSKSLIETAESPGPFTQPDPTTSQQKSAIASPFALNHSAGSSFPWTAYSHSQDRADTVDCMDPHTNDQAEHQSFAPPSPAETITTSNLPLDNLSLSFSQAETCDTGDDDALMHHMKGHPLDHGHTSPPFDDTSSNSETELCKARPMSDVSAIDDAHVTEITDQVVHDKAERYCVEVLVVKKHELDDRLYLDFESLGHSD